MDVLIGGSSHQFFNKLPGKELTTESRKKISEKAMAFSGLMVVYSADMTNTNSRAPTPPKVNGIAAKSDDMRNTAQYCGISVDGMFSEPKSIVAAINWIT